MTVAAVRPMRMGDAAAVARLSVELGYPVKREDIQERFARLAKDPQESVFVACDGDSARTRCGCGRARSTSGPDTR